MSKKKVYKLRKWPKILIFIIILFAIFSFIFNKYYQQYLWEHSNNYYLLKKGYSTENVNDFKSKLNDNEVNEILNRDYNEFIPEFVKCKYFLYKNLDEYLDQVITKDEDFFKYHGTDGYDYEHIVGVVNTHMNNEEYSLDLNVDISKGVEMLVNKQYKLGDFEPDDLVDIDWKYRFGLQNDKYQLRSEAYNAFLDMWNDANNNGIYLMILSAHRNHLEQEKEYNIYKNSKGELYADKVAARPGYSEHQTGLAIDVYSKKDYKQNTFKDSDTYKWLIDNSYKYGYILRYPLGKEDITGYKYESWHFRYVGKDLALKIFETGDDYSNRLTLDEYYAFYLDN